MGRAAVPSLIVANEAIWMHENYPKHAEPVNGSSTRAEQMPLENAGILYEFHRIQFIFRRKNVGTEKKSRVPKGAEN